jgi:hypothetical protein
MYSNQSRLPNLALWDQGAPPSAARWSPCVRVSPAGAPCPTRRAAAPLRPPAGRCARCRRGQVLPPPAARRYAKEHVGLLAETFVLRGRERANGCYAEPPPRCQIVTTAVTPRQGGKACLDPTQRPRGWLRIGEMGEEWASARPSPGRRTSGRGENPRELSSPVRPGQRWYGVILPRSAETGD